MNDVIGVYCIENVKNNKKYIGQSIHVYKRWKEHKSALNRDVHENDYLQKAWRKYGQDAFVFFVIEICEESMLNDRESYYICYFNTIDRNFGYNLDSGGSSYRIISAEARSKMSAAKADCFGEKNSFYGKQHTEETKQKLRDRWNDESWSNNVRVKMKANHANEFGENNPMYGKKHTEESKRLMSENTLKLYGSDNYNSKSIYCIELNMHFGSIVEGASYVGISRNMLSGHLNNKRKSAGKHPITKEPLHWIYTDNLTQQNN